MRGGKKGARKKGRKRDYTVCEVAFHLRLDWFFPFLLSILYVQLFPVEGFCEDGERCNVAAVDDGIAPENPHS